MAAWEAQDRVATREALAATIAAVLRQNARRSAHPADRAAVRREADQVADALDAEFLVFARHCFGAELPAQQLNEHVHE